jgi:hypothetical protein
MVVLASQRTTVRLEDGRTGVLFYWPVRELHRSGSRHQSKAKVRFPDGTVVNVVSAQIVEILL